MQIDIGEVVIDAVEPEGGRWRASQETEARGGKENRFAQSAFVGIQDLMD